MSFIMYEVEKIGWKIERSCMCVRMILGKNKKELKFNF